VRYTASEHVQESPLISSYKVLVPKANGSGALGETLSTPIIGVPMMICTQTFIAIGRFSNPVETENLLKYVKTKFARVMLGILKTTQDNPRGTWKFVPWQDFTSTSDIDWSQAVAEIDRQLFKKYGLDAQEISFIEENIREME
jgi:hypothetical protein